MSAPTSADIVRDGDFAITDTCVSMRKMNRREFIKCGAVLAPTMTATSLWPKAEQREIAFTFDDPKTDDCGGMHGQEVNALILAALSRHRIKAVLFVIGRHVD